MAQRVEGFLASSELHAPEDLQDRQWDLAEEQQFPMNAYGLSIVKIVDYFFSREMISCNAKSKVEANKRGSQAGSTCQSW